MRSETFGHQVTTVRTVLQRMRGRAMLADAVARLISWRSGLRLASADLAAQHAVALEDVKRAERELQRELRLSADQVW